jgi:hypothetical protein
MVCILACAALPAVAAAQSWTTGLVDDHILGGQTLSYRTTPLPAVSDATLTLRYGLWNSPDVVLEVYVNGTFAGSAVADQGYVSPGPAYAVWPAGPAMTSGTQLVEVVALASTGEAVVGEITIDYIAGDLDQDEDGWSVADGDCEDLDPAIHPGAAESCNGIDDNCDGLLPPEESDEDGDGVAECQGDCNDQDGNVGPSASESCNGIDDDCDGVIPPEEADQDGDGFSICEGDCDDGLESVHPGAAEVCDGLDTNCDGDLLSIEVDADEDGHLACDDDCDDGLATVHPGAQEICNGLDDDCDGEVADDESDCDGPGSAACACSVKHGNAPKGAALLALALVWPCLRWRAARSR